LVNERPELLNGEIRNFAGLPADCGITWKSPLADDGFAEYSDQCFLDLLGIEGLRVPLSGFWPAMGPNWDGLATTSDGGVVLLEAKANIREMASDPCGATSEASLKLIKQSLAATQKHMKISGTRARPELWLNAFYQYANRISHLYYLRVLNDIPAHLVFLNIVNDPDSGDQAVSSASEWEGLRLLAESCLGLSPSKPLMEFVHHVHVDVADWQ